MPLAFCFALPACGDSAETPAWTEAFDAAESGWLMNVWGTGEDDLYAMGGTLSAGRITHFDGASWTALELGVSVPLLTWVYGFGRDNMTAVGFAGTVVHWDGAAWTIQPTPTDQDLWGIWGSAPDDLWAVGGSGREGGLATLLHYDGSDWAQVEFPAPMRANVRAFFKVFGTGADNVYVVGQRGVVLHFDGQVWSEELVGASDDLVSIWGTGPDRLVAVGGRSSGIVSLWNGSEWRTESLAPLPGLNGIWMNKPGVAHVVGTLGTLIELDLETFEYTLFPVTTGLCFHATFSAAGETLIAVGGNLLAVAETFTGVAFQRRLSRDE